MQQVCLFAFLSLFYFVFSCLPSILFWLLECIETDGDFYFMALLVLYVCKYVICYNPRSTKELTRTRL